MLRSARQLWVVVHRWAGLTMALFLAIAGATGALLPYNEALTLAGRPALSAAAPQVAGSPPLDAATLAERVMRQTGAVVPSMNLDVPRDHVAQLSVAARPGAPALGYDTVWADPYTGQVRLTYRYGVLADGPQTIMQFLFLLHYSLALGTWGTLAFGVAAMVWTLDCFVGFYLTLPIRRARRLDRPLPRRRAPADWLSRWRPAWTVRGHARGYKLNFDLHRAGGLWLWPLLLVFAWSSVGFNLPAVHGPVMRALGSTAPAQMPALATPVARPALDLRAAMATGERLVRAEGARRGFAFVHPSYLWYNPATGIYYYGARTSLDIVSEGGRTAVWFRGSDGHLVRFDPPVTGSAADKTMMWFYMLHMAQVFGLPYRIFVSALGLGVVALSVTGVIIWMKKRSARLLGRQRRPRRVASAGRLLQPAE